MSFRPLCAPLHFHRALHGSSLLDALGCRCPSVCWLAAPVQPIRPPHVAQDETKNITNSTKGVQQHNAAQHTAAQRNNGRDGHRKRRERCMAQATPRTATQRPAQSHGRLHTTTVAVACVWAARAS